MQQLIIGQVVRNFGELGKVTGFHSVTGDPIIRSLYANGSSWVANSNYCIVLDNSEVMELRHQSGFVQF